MDFYRAELACAADWLRAHGHTLEDAGPEDIEQYLAAERLRNLSPASIEAHYRALSAYYRWLHSRSFGRLKNQQPGEHWIAQVERPANPKKEPRRTTPEQVETLLSSIDPETWLDWRDRALVRVMFWSGLRVSEAVALTVADLDMANRRIRVQHGKGDKPRSVRYHPAANADLLHYLYSRPDPADVRLWLSDNGAGGVRGALTDVLSRPPARRPLPLPAARRQAMPCDDLCAGLGFWGRAVRYHLNHSIDGNSQHPRDRVGLRERRVAGAGDAAADGAGGDAHGLGQVALGHPQFDQARLHFRARPPRFPDGGGDDDLL